MGQLTGKDHIHNLAVCCCRIKYYLSGMTRSKFEEDIKTKDAVRYCLYIMGKSLEGIEKTTMDKYPGFPSWLTLILFMDNGYSENDLWDVLNDEKMGVMKYFSRFARMYELELLDSQEAEKQKLELFTSNEDKVKKDKDLGLDTNYRYPIKSNRSIWTVKMK